MLTYSLHKNYREFKEMYILKDEKGRNYSDYSHEEYHDNIEALNNSKLKKFYESPDSYFLVTVNKIEFEIGKAFESIVFDKAFGTKFFKEKYHILDIELDRPGDAMKIYDQVIKNEILPESLIVKNKDESDKKNSKNVWLRILMETGNKFPLKMEEFKMLDLMSDNFLKMKFKGLTMMHIIQNSIIERPFVWEKDGLIKKCKPDILFTTRDQIFLIDIKTYGKPVDEFNWQVKNLKYWIQAVHYREGVQAHYTQLVSPMYFTVAAKPKPNLSMVWGFQEKEFYSKLEKSYDLLCEKFKNWEAGGMHKIGYQEKIGNINFRIEE